MPTRRGSRALGVSTGSNSSPDKQKRPVSRADEPSCKIEANLFGWHLDRDALDFLAAVDAELDVDEYDMTPGEDTI
ncbi:hypothetical protein [Kitasatospora sp. NBC_01266]|uniref:hypothetical protein n=1 Tax=Kitasatospora sp. NBC_01266 TaxID=2903572 RepID=UPI002E347234|nr:hypothetical protein [Kitasatospora sp. NBC_01266]